MLLVDLIAPLSIIDFAGKYLFKEPYAVSGSAGQLRKFFHWEMLIEILSSKYPNCWLPRFGKLPEDQNLASGVLSFTQAREYFEKGHTILVRHSEKAHPKLKVIADEFQQLFNAPIDIQLYCTPPSEEGFDWHYDIEEVFVVQTSGAKEFRLRPPSPDFNREKEVSLPKTLNIGEELPGPEMACLLKAGDFMYIPAGYWHKAKALSPSFHLSIGVLRPKGLASSSALS